MIGGREMFRVSGGRMTVVAKMMQSRSVCSRHMEVGLAFVIVRRLTFPGCGVAVSAAAAAAAVAMPCLRPVLASGEVDAAAK